MATWFDKLSPKAKTAYLRKHPNSKFHGKSFLDGVKVHPNYQRQVNKVMNRNGMTYRNGKWIKK